MEVKTSSKWAYQRFADREFERYFGEFFGKEGRDEYLTFSIREKKLFFKAVEDGKTVGVASLHIGRNVAKIGAFIVAKDRRGAGAGSMLLGRCEAAAKRHKCRKIWLWTFPSSKAYGFYKRKGYAEEARLERQWGGKRTLSVMSKFL